MYFVEWVIFTHNVSSLIAVSGDVNVQARAIYILVCLILTQNRNKS